jgi:acetyl-CoA carboxylase biotin carboxyl carrier protein
MDLRKIKKLIELVEESGIAELEVSSGEESIRIARYSGPPAFPSILEQSGSLPVSVTHPSSVAPGSPAYSTAPAGSQVTAPMAGVFYAAPAPDAEPFIRVGQAVAPGDVLCIIESMKMMNEIKAEQGGTCGEIAVQSGQAVASGDLLFRLI